jgi:cation:H+ antiporter
MSILLYIGLFVVSVVVTLGGCALFTNGIEWLGKRLKVPEGAVGSIFAAVGTTLPETSIPFIAIFFGRAAEDAEVGLGAILGAPFMLSTLVLPILAGLLLLYAWMGKRSGAFHVRYADVRIDLLFFLAAYGLALVCVFVPSRAFHAIVAVGLVAMYVRYMMLKFSADTSDAGAPSELEPLIFARRAAVPPYALITAQGIAGLVGLVIGAHLFVTAAKSLSVELHISPLLLSLLIAPLATELPEMSNSFLWLYQKKDTLAVGNVTGAMVFQGTFPVTFGLLGTSWTLAPTAVGTMVLAFIAAGLSVAQLLGKRGHWRPWLLIGMALLYLAFTAYLYAS